VEWTSDDNGELSQSIYTCDPQRCSSQDKERVISWNDSYIVGLHVAIDCGIILVAVILTESVFLNRGYT